MSKKKKDKKGKQKKDQQKKQKTDNKRLSKLSKNAASLGTALVGAVSAEGAQATIAKMVEKGANSDRLVTVRHTVKEAAGAAKNIASAVQAVLQDADAGVVDAATSLKDKAENTQASAGKVVTEAVATLKDVADSATSSAKHKKKKP